MIPLLEQLGGGDCVAGNCRITEEMPFDSEKKRINERQVASIEYRGNGKVDFTE